MRKRNVWLIPLIVTVVLAAGLVIWLQIGAHASTKGTQPSVSASATPHKAVMSEANVELLEQALSSPDMTQQAQALVMELRGDFLAQGQPMLPPGVSVKLEQDTFQINQNVGQINAVTSTGEVYLLHLVLENGMWLILYTEEA